MGCSKWSVVIYKIDWFLRLEILSTNKLSFPHLILLEFFNAQTINMKLSTQILIIFRFFSKYLKALNKETFVDLQTRA